MILVDPAIWRWRGRRWAHLVSDTSHEELHAFALSLGLRRIWFQGDHYDIPAELRLVALELGAVPVDARELVLRISAAGLRKRRTRAPIVPVSGPAHAAAGHGELRYAPGVPSWIDLTTSDPRGAMDFYGNLLGWDFHIGGPQTGGYTYCRVRGRAVAGLNGQPAPDGWPSAWTTYLATSDADTDAARVRAAGGTVLLGPLDACPAGRTVIARDPAGALFGLWQAGTHPGAELLDEHGAMAWNELITPELDRAQSFYGALFDYAFEAAAARRSGSRTIVKDDRPVAGMRIRLTVSLPPAWVPYVATRDVDEAAIATQDLGGTLLGAPRDAPFGRWVLVRDPQGALLALVTLQRSAPGAR